MTTPVTFFQQTRDELKKVVWPSRSEIIRLTGLVIGVSTIVSLFIGALDLTFTKLLQLVVK